jgi:3-methyladenine DNA glycosylase AlkD
LRRAANPAKAAILRRFFKTGPGEYGEGDRFLGLTVPQIRALAKQNGSLGAKSLQVLLNSGFHEERLLALLILVSRFQKGSEAERSRVYRFYVRNLHRINNWDLVDLTAPHIVGPVWFDGGPVPIQRWVTSKNLWERRIAIVATFHFIRQNRFGETLKIAGLLLEDPEDLIHKATGWMLREVGKRDRAVLEGFLKKYHRKMPRTMLRYAIERFPEEKRKRYLRR